jgi:hypothetical protein
MQNGNGKEVAPPVESTAPAPNIPETVSTAQIKEENRKYWPQQQLTPPEE